MIESLIGVLILIAILSLIGWGISSLLPVPPQVKTVIWVVIGVICLLLIYRAFTGHSLHT